MAGFYHAHDPVSGELVAVSMGSEAMVRLWQDNGLSVAAAASRDAQGAPVGPDSHHYLGGALTAKLEVSLSADKSEILADGLDQAVVSVTIEGEGPPGSIELLVGDGSEVVALQEGNGALSPISALTPCNVLVRPADGITFRAEPVIIEAKNDE